MHRAITLVAACILLVACGTTQQRARSDARTGLRWVGTFQQTVSRSGTLEARGTHKTTGRILLEESRNPQRMRVTMNVSAPGYESQTLTWAILAGSCGSAAFPVASYQQFPVVEIGTNGRGELSAELPISLEVTVGYHANVYYAGGVQLSHVLTCTNLRLQ